MFFSPWLSNVSTAVPQANEVSGKSGAMSTNEAPYCEPWAMIKS